MLAARAAAAAAAATRPPLPVPTQPPLQAKIRLLLRVFAAIRLQGTVRRLPQAGSQRSVHSWGRQTSRPSPWTFTQARVPWIVACAEAGPDDMGKNDLSAANTTASVQVCVGLQDCSATRGSHAAALPVCCTCVEQCHADAAVRQLPSEC